MINYIPMPGTEDTWRDMMQIKTVTLHQPISATKPRYIQDLCGGKQTQWVVHCCSIISLFGVLFLFVLEGKECELAVRQTTAAPTHATWFPHCCFPLHRVRMYGMEIDLCWAVHWLVTSRSANLRFISRSQPVQTCLSQTGSNTAVNSRQYTHPFSNLEVISAFSGLAEPNNGFLTVISLMVSISRAKPAFGTSSSNVTTSHTFIHKRSFCYSQNHVLTACMLRSKLVSCVDRSHKQKFSSANPSK